MKVFISWSGSRSKAVAELIEEWIKCVLQSSRPWISTKNIEKGSVWYSEISEQLNQTTAGIVCLTPENKDNRWILFEAGALAKGLSASRVYTFLVEMEPSDIEDPLAQFNHTRPNYVEMLSLAGSLNGRLDQPLSEVVLKKVFDVYWPTFKADYQRVLEANLPEEKVEIRTQDSKIDELLSSMRGLVSRVRDIEQNASAGTMNFQDAQAAIQKARSGEARKNEVMGILSSGMKAGESLSEIHKKLQPFGFSAEYVSSMIESYNMTPPTNTDLS